MPNKLRAAVIGTGGISANHIHGYLASGRYEVVALADLSVEAMAEKNEQFDIAPAHYTDGREMMEKERPDVVSICTWHKGHAPWTVTAAAFKPQAILCEKPMADTVGAAEQMMIACRRNDVKLAIGHQRRFLPSYTLAKELIACNAIGDVSLIQSMGGAGLPNYSSHQADMYRYLLSDGRVRLGDGQHRAQDRPARARHPYRGPRHGSLPVRKRARAMILSDLVPNYYQGAQIFGSEGMISITTESLEILNAKSGGRWEKHVPDGKFYSVEELGSRFEWQEGAAAQADELADWVDGKVDAHRGKGEHGYKALQMIHAVYESARMHEKVEMPLQTRSIPST